MYTVDGLRHGIERAKVNITSLEEAIARERSTIKDYKIMIADLDRAERRMAEAEAGINVEVVRDDPE